MRPVKVSGGELISIHALREEGDDRAVVRDHECRGFLSTPSARRATLHDWAENTGQIISIHALREEGDALPEAMSCKATIFLSTPSARRATGAASRRQSRIRNFYPRPPRGGRHEAGRKKHRECDISIHALREEGDLVPLCLPLSPVVFLSTPSARRATQCERPGKAGKKFLSTPSARRATHSGRHGTGLQAISIHALREEGDLKKLGRAIVRQFISIHALREEGDP